MNTITSETQLRLPILEWSVRKNAGRLEGLGWIDSTVNPEAAAFVVHGSGDVESFRHLPYLTFIPNYIGWSATKAQERGEVTAWEGLQLLFAESHWAVMAREYLWTPHSPYPMLLCGLVERYGVERALHRGDPVRLGRLTSLLPARLHTRGTLEVATEILQACDASSELKGIYKASDKEATDALQHEVFACHDAAWWRARNTPETAHQYRIEGSLLRFQSPGGPSPLRREDLLLTLNSTHSLPTHLFRLLPVWAVFRITTQPKVTP